MSVEARKAVWKHSKHSGTRLVLMLAIADHINEDEGNVAWPSVRRLAALARSSERQTQRCLCALKKSGELEIIPNQGPKGSNLYKIGLPSNVTRDIAVTSDTQGGTPVTSAVAAGDKRVTQSVNEPLTERTPLVPKGDDKEFWINICFECFGQVARPLHPRLIAKLKSFLHVLEKKNAPSLITFYRLEPIDSKEKPFNSRKYSPQRLMLHLPEQLALAAQTCPPPPPKKEEPLRWREFFRWKYPDCILPKSFEDLSRDIREEYESEFDHYQKALVQGSKGADVPTTDYPNASIAMHGALKKLTDEKEPVEEVVIASVEVAKRLICEKILRQDSKNEWGRLANSALQELCKVGLPLAQIELIAWFRSVPKDNSVPELKERFDPLIVTTLVLGWMKELARANAYWQRMHRE